MSKEISYQDIVNDVKNKEVLVLGGFSGLGYQDEVKVEAYLRKVLKIVQERAKEGNRETILIGGATSDGIGAIGYKVAKEFNVKTFGIVSEQAKQWGVDKNCDETFYVPDPEGTWKVLFNDNGQEKSYFVDVAKQAAKGEMLYLGGGDVAVSEAKEGISSNVEVNFKSFEPNPEKCAKKGVTSEKAKTLENYINSVFEFPVEHDTSYVQFKDGFSKVIKESISLKEMVDGLKNIVGRYAKELESNPYQKGKIEELNKVIREMETGLTM